LMKPTFSASGGSYNMLLIKHHFQNM
jgi:hypothetical protein